MYLLLECGRSNVVGRFYPHYEIYSVMYRQVFFYLLGH